MSQNLWIQKQKCCQWFDKVELQCGGSWEVGPNNDRDLWSYRHFDNFHFTLSTLRHFPTRYTIDCTCTYRDSGAIQEITVICWNVRTESPHRSAAVLLTCWTAPGCQAPCWNGQTTNHSVSYHWNISRNDKHLILHQGPPPIAGPSLYLSTQTQKLHRDPGLKIIYKYPVILSTLWLIRNHSVTEFNVTFRVKQKFLGNVMFTQSR